MWDRKIVMGVQNKSEHRIVRGLPVCRHYSFIYTGSFAHTHVLIVDGRI